MFEFLCKCNAGIKTRGKIFLTIFIIMFCLVLASAVPLRVYASGLVIAELVNLVISALSGTFVATALATSGVYIIVALLAGMAVSFTASMLIQAIQAQVDNGNWAVFLDNIRDSYSLDNTKTRLGLTMLKFVFAYNWVKTNIIGFFDEKVSSVNDGKVYFSPEYTIPTNGTKKYQLVINGLPCIDYSQDSSFSNYPKYGYLLSQPYEDLTTNPYSASRNGANGMNMNYYINSTNPLSSTQMHRAELMFNDNFGIYLCWNYNFSPRVYLGNVLLPYVKSYGESKPEMLFRWSNSTWVNGQMNSSNYLAADASKWGLIIDGNYYGAVTYATKRINGVDKKCIAVDDRNGTRYFFAMDTSKSFTSQGQGIYYLVNGGTGVLYENNLSTSASNEKTSATYTVVNNYYYPAKDTYKGVAEAGASAIASGAISGTSVNDVSIGISDTASTVTDVTSSTTISDVASIESINTVSGVSVPIPVAFQIAGTNIKLGLSDIKNKFPFDVIYVSATWLQNLVSNGEAPVWDITLSNPLIGNKTAHIDFGRYQTVATVSNWVVLVSVAIGCLVNSRKAFNFFGGD